jgi:flagella basal body P-ring formation protein FlgA
MIRYLFVPLLLAASAPALAQTRFQDTVALDRAVAGFTGHALGDVGGARAPVDSRLRLASCGTVALAAVAAPAPFAAAVRALPVIKRGDPVTVEAGSPGFSITREGIAMGDAPAGGRLLIKVDQTRQPIQAVAIESGRATLPGLAN